WGGNVTPWGKGAPVMVANVTTGAAVVTPRRPPRLLADVRNEFFPGDGLPVNGYEGVELPIPSFADVPQESLGSLGGFVGRRLVRVEHIGFDEDPLIGQHRDQHPFG